MNVSFKNKPNNTQAQILLEFMFCMIIVFLLVFSLVKVVRWSGKDFKGIVSEHSESFSDEPGKLKTLFWSQKDFKPLDSVYNKSDLIPED